MDSIFQSMDHYFQMVVQFGILLVDIIGIAVLFGAVVRALAGLVRKHDHIRLELAEGIALTLELKMAGELLRTLIVNKWSELLLLGTIILLHAALTLLIQWEIRMEKKHHKDRLEARQVSKDSAKD